MCFKKWRERREQEHLEMIRQVVENHPESPWKQYQRILDTVRKENEEIEEQEWVDTQKWLESEQRRYDMSGKMPYCGFCKFKNKYCDCIAKQCDREKQRLCAKAFKIMKDRDTENNIKNTENKEN